MEHMLLGKEWNVDISVGNLTERIQENCNISDAHYAGVYSLCSLLLRLRDLYKWQHGVPPWEEPEPAKLLGWVDSREEMWEHITTVEFLPLEVGDESFDPFDVTGINARLRPLGLVYGAGYATGMKPSFFLAHLKESRQLGDLRVSIVGHELARDIFMAPAMRQGDEIFARPAAMMFFLWDQILEMRPSAREALIYALAQHDLNALEVRSSPKDLGPALEPIALLELDTWIYHEIGEVREDAFNGSLWHEIVSTYSNSPIEIFARVVKDLLADTHSEGLLGHIIEHGIKSSLGFYVSFMRPFTRLLFPEIIEAFSHFRSNGDWGKIEKARADGHSKAHGHARALVDFHEAGRRRGDTWAKAKIISEILGPLGISGASMEKQEGDPE